MDSDMIDTVVIERYGNLYLVRYNDVYLAVPAFRIESAVQRAMRLYHDAKGVGR